MEPHAVAIDLHCPPLQSNATSTDYRRVPRSVSTGMRVERLPFATFPGRSVQDRQEPGGRVVPPRGRRPVGRRQNPRARRDLDAHAPDKIGPDTEALSGCSNAPDGEEWLVLQQVMRMLRMSRSLFYAGMKRRGFPRPTRIGPRDPALAEAFCPCTGPRYALQSSIRRRRRSKRVDLA